MLSMKPSVLLLFFALLLLLLMLLFVILSCIMQHWFYKSSFQLEAEIKKKEKNVVKKTLLQTFLYMTSSWVVSRGRKEVFSNQL